MKPIDMSLKNTVCDFCVPEYIDARHNSVVRYRCMVSDSSYGDEPCRLSNWFSCPLNEQLRNALRE